MERLRQIRDSLESHIYQSRVYEYGKRVKDFLKPDPADCVIMSFLNLGAPHLNLLERVIVSSIVYVPIKTARRKLDI